MTWRRLCLVVLCFVCTAPALASDPIRIVDDRGVEVTLPRSPQRIVSLLPSLTETICALQACDRLVGVDDYSNWPASVKTLPHVGGLEDANVERIVALKPDLVMLARSARATERLEGLGLKVVTLEPKSMKDLERVLGQVGRVLGRESDATALWQQLDGGVQRVAATLPAAARGKRVYFEVNSAPFAASESSFIGETLSRLGVANVVPGALGPFPQLNPEFVVRANPQIIMVGDRNAVALSARPGWEAIDAVKARRVCIFTAADGDVLVRPGPRMVEAATIMANCLKDKFK
ncbi:helical backbone metal receptor [Variovorax sp. J22R133]|uniref:ABC transporter substrate-binding protein n=1 Tax=Variovorax brevis TaxID=3053503 RepID=UPI002577388F|nr:helical backbone metal receptor [Variovorax sp. J22R133]MDM0112534.1 helical backbone metal receptor [Variovorax sp. J22R133]